MRYRVPVTKNKNIKNEIKSMITRILCSFAIIFIVNTAYAAPLTFDCKFQTMVTKKSRDFSKNDIQVRNEVFEFKILLNDNEAFFYWESGNRKIIYYPASR